MRGHHLGLALQAVRDRLAHHVVRPVDQEAVSRREPLEVFVEQQAQRLQVGLHVAVGRVDHHRRALHQMVAGEQQLLLLQQIAQMVRRMARRVDHAQRRVGAEFDAVAVLRARCRAGTSVSCHSGKLATRPNSGAPVAAFNACAAGRMVLVRVRDQDARHRPGRGREQRLHVRSIVGARVDQRTRPTRAADEVAVGARPGHHAAVVGA